MTKPTQLTLHAISIALMIGVLQLGLWLSTDIMLTILTAIGSMAWGVGWKFTTDYLLKKYD